MKVPGKEVGKAPRPGLMVVTLFGNVGQAALGRAARASANERSVREGDSGADIFSAKRVGLLAGQGRWLCGLTGGWNRHR